jgi:hypothetical protein
MQEGATIETYPPLKYIKVNLMSTANKFWPLDYDPEGEIYENLAWDLPGFRSKRRSSRKPLAAAGPSRKSAGRK